MPRLHARLRCAVAMPALLAGLSAAPVLAQDQVVAAQFEVRYGPLQVGRGTFEARIGTSNYAIGVSARVSGVARLFVGGEGSASVNGSYQGSRVLTDSYEINNTVGEGTNAIRIGMRGGAVASERVHPPVIPLPDRIPVHEVHRRGVVDPLSAFVLPVDGGGELVQASTCDRTVKIYDGRARYDLALSFGRIEQLRVRDYEGPALVCSARYNAVAGHRRLPPGEAQDGARDMETWFIPVNGTRVLLLYRMYVTTPAGRVTIQATRVSITGGSRQAAAQ